MTFDASSPYRAIANRSTSSMRSGGTMSAAGSKSERLATRMRSVLRSLRYASTTRARISGPNRTSSRKSTLATQRRRISAPLCLITSSGGTSFPRDFDIFLPASVTTMPCVTTWWYGARPRVPSAHQHRALEPAAVLVVALEVEVGRPAQFRVDGQHGLVARARVEPDVEDVLLALERRPAARRAREPGRQEVLDRALVPGLGAVLLEQRGRLRRPAAASAWPCRTTCR